MRSARGWRAAEVSGSGSEWKRLMATGYKCREIEVG